MTEEDAAEPIHLDHDRFHERRQEVAVLAAHCDEHQSEPGPVNQASGCHRIPHQSAIGVAAHERASGSLRSTCSVSTGSGPDATSPQETMSRRSRQTHREHCLECRKVAWMSR